MGPQENLIYAPLDARTSSRGVARYSTAGIVSIARSDLGFFLFYDIMEFLVSDGSRFGKIMVSMMKCLRNLWPRIL